MRRILVLLVILAFSLFAKVNINTATAQQLSSLSGIGPKKAQAIIEYRKAHGPFKSINDLIKVKGIGPKMVEKLKKEAEVK